MRGLYLSHRGDVLTGISGHDLVDGRIAPAKISSVRLKHEYTVHKQTDLAVGVDDRSPKLVTIRFELVLDFLQVHSSPFPTCPLQPCASSSIPSCVPLEPSSPTVGEIWGEGVARASGAGAAPVGHSKDDGPDFLWGPANAFNSSVEAVAPSNQEGDDMICHTLESYHVEISALVPFGLPMLSFEVTVWTGVLLLIAGIIYLYRNGLDRWPRAKTELKTIASWLTLGYVILLGIGICFAIFELIFPEKFVTIMDTTWHIEKNKQFVLDTFTLNNTTGSALKDFTIGCDATANSGTAIVMLRATLFEVLKKNETKSFIGLPMGKYPDQAVSAACRVVDAHIVK